jgi:hypothetical protein
MANGRKKSEWIQTANIMAVIFNANVTKQNRKDPIDFMPAELRERPVSDDRIQITMDDLIGIVKQVKPQ